MNGTIKKVYKRPLNLPFYIDFRVLNSIKKAIETLKFTVYINFRVLNSIKSGILSSSINIIYLINHLFNIILDLDRGKPPLSTVRNGQFINFLSIIHHFQIETIISQDLAAVMKPVSYRSCFNRSGPIPKSFAILYLSCR